MVTIAMGKDMMSPKTIATEGHNGDGRFSDITDEPLYIRVTRCPLLKSDNAAPPRSLQRCFVLMCDFLNLELAKRLKMRVV
jgi:hypothetical protein